MEGDHSAKPGYATLIAQVLVVLWAAWECKELIHLYQLETPYDSYPGLFFFLWLAPFLYFWAGQLKAAGLAQTNLSLTYAAILFILLGRIISFEFPGQIALALALGALLPARKEHFLWMLSALCWIHPFKWFVLQLSAPYFVTPVRLLFLALGLGSFARKRT